MSGWAIDLGTTNTGVARWDETADRPRLVELPDVCRLPGGEDHLEAPRLVPSATEANPDPGFWGRVARRGPLARLSFWGRLAWIGRAALERNEAAARPGFSATFKPHLGRDALRILARAGGRSYTARDVAWLFMRELLAQVKRTSGERLRDVVVTTPVESYESYRAELLRIGRRLGIKRMRFIDEPVAAALGYDVGLKAERHVLVVDFGGGTLDLAVVRLAARELATGACRVVAKEGRAVGGDLVDRWLLDEFCQRLDYPLREDARGEDQAFWYRLMLGEARRVKEAVFFADSETFYLSPPEELRAFEARLRGGAEPLTVGKGDVRDILAARGLYDVLEGCVDGIEAQLARAGMAPDDLDDVLMVGGSTLLPDLYGFFEARYGRDRVRAWKPFEAVAYGAAAYAAGRYAQSDFIVHDYAFVTHDARTHDPQQTVIIPRGTRFPTAPDLWQRKLVPTCSLGEPERVFKLVISEVGRAHGDERGFGWDGDGQLHKLGGRDGADGAPLVVPLNEANPALGRLDPPHQPGDRQPRLQIAFGVNEERWLVATVRDLKTRKLLMKQEPVVRLL